MHPRLIVIGLIALLEIFLLLGAAVSETGAPDYEAYVVGQGETLATIATQYGISVDYLAQFNKLTVADGVKAGQIIVVPKVTQMTSQVSPTATQATATTPTGNQVEGVLATVTAAKTQIWNRPGGGVLLFSKAEQGTSLLVIGQSGTFYAVLMSDGNTGWVPKAGVTVSQDRMMVDRPTPTIPTAPAASPTDGGQPVLVQTAFEYLGIPYKYGGRLPKNVDCSLLVQTVFARNGLKLPRTAAQQFQVGTPVDVQQLQAGDRLYFTDRSGNIGHTALYIGNGRFIHASSNRGYVAVDELSNNTYWRIYAGARR